MFDSSTNMLLGINPLCQQSASKELLVVLGVSFSIAPGLIGKLLPSAWFSPSLSEDGLSFVVFGLQVPPVDPVDSYGMAWNVYLINGPQEIGSCDPISLRVSTFSAMPSYFIWDCPKCLQNTQLNSALAMETGPIIVLGPELFSDVAYYAPITIRARFDSAFAQQSELMHSFTKVPLPLPSVVVEGSTLSGPAADTASRLETGWTAKSSHSRCDPIMERSQMNFFWNISQFPNYQYPAVLDVHGNTGYSEESSYDVQVWSTSRPMAIASVITPVYSVPRVFKVALRMLSGYILEVLLGDERAFAGMSPFEELNASLMWECWDGKLPCLNMNGERLGWRTESKHLLIPENETVEGMALCAACSFHRHDDDDEGDDDDDNDNVDLLQVEYTNFGSELHFLMAKYDKLMWTGFRPFLNTINYKLLSTRSMVSFLQMTSC